MSKKSSKKVKNRDLKLRWKGALKDLRKDYTSVELQHRFLIGGKLMYLGGIYDIET
jgi:hypothetical protein